jgi:hypothetical protein
VSYGGVFVRTRIAIVALCLAGCADDGAARFRDEQLRQSAEAAAARQREEDQNRSNIEAVRRRKEAEDGRAREEAGERDRVVREREEREADVAEKHDEYDAKARRLFAAFLEDSRAKGIPQSQLPPSVELLSNPETVRGRDLVLEGVPTEWFRGLKETGSGGLSFRIVIPPNATLDGSTRIGPGHYFVEVPFARITADAKGHSWNAQTAHRLVLRLEGTADFVNALGIALKLPKLRAVAMSDSWFFVTDRNWKAPGDSAGGGETK